MRRLAILPFALAAGCFLDATGLDDDNAGGTGTGGVPSAGNGPTGGNGATGGGPHVGGDAAGGSGGMGGGSISGGGGDGGAAGGAGGAGCAAGYLLLDEDDRAEVPSDPAFNDTGPFTFGARIRLDAIPSTFESGDDEWSEAYPFERWQSGDPGIGYWIAFAEDWDGSEDDGQPHVSVTIVGPGIQCTVAQDEVFEIGSFHHVAGSFDTSGNLTLYVDGIAAGSDGCGGQSLPAFEAPIAVGSAGPGISGAVDDVFLHGAANMASTTSPVGCNGGMIAAFPFDSEGLGTTCEGSYTFELLGAPNDPEHVCDE
ncbi:MAG: hypothetical protein HOW73_09085 [Polyangiaceae bacterium]|nr:hypothetical protein [Polyangiaceae bacterium]